MPKRFKIHKLVLSIAAVLGALTEMAIAQESQTVTPASTPAAKLIRSNLDTFSNQGVIAPSYSPLINGFEVDSFINTGTGIISGSFAALLNEGVIGTLSNAGAIGIRSEYAGLPDIGIYNAGAIGTLVNTGVLRGSETGIFNPARIGAIVNQGAIGLANPTAVGIANDGSVESIRNESTISASSTGVWNSGTVTAFENASSISGNEVGVANAISGLPHPHVAGKARTIGSIRSLTNEAAGTISGSVAGVWNGAEIRSLHNAGVILGTTALINQRKGTINAVVNDGSLAGVNAGFFNAGTIGDIENIGSLTGTMALINQGAIDTFSNHGSAKGLLAGLANTGVMERFVNHGTIDSRIDVIENRGWIGRLENHGYIVKGHTAISNYGGKIDSIFNTGVMVAKESGINNAHYYAEDRESGFELGPDEERRPIRFAQLGDIYNNGVIAARIAIYTDAAIGTIVNPGVIMGDIINLSENDVNIVGGKDKVFGILSGNAGEKVLAHGNGVYGWSEDVMSGLLRSPLGNVNFIGGNTLLADNVDLHDRGTLTLSAGTVKLTDPICVAGNYRQRNGATLLIGVQNGAVAAGGVSDTGYGQFVLTGSAIIDAGATISLQKSADYAFAPGQRFVVVDAASSSSSSAGDTAYNADALKYTVVGAPNVRPHGASVVSGDGTRTSLVVSLAAVQDAVGVGPGAGERDGDGEVVAEGAANANVNVNANANAKINVAAAMGALKGLGAYTGISQAALLNLYNAGQAIRVASGAGMQQAQDKLSPLSQATALRAAMSPTYDTMRLLGARMDAMRRGTEADQRRLANVSSSESKVTGSIHAEPRQAIWAQALGAHVRQSQTDEVAGYRGNFGGLVLGADKTINARWRAGGAFAYSNMGIDQADRLAGNTTKVNGYGLFGYASYAAPKWYANVSAGAVYQHYQTIRRIDFPGFSGSANGRFSGSQWIAHGEVAYPLTFGVATLTPIASLRYGYLRHDDHTESGGNGAALTVDAAHATSIQSDLGVRLHRTVTSRFGVLVPSIQVGWRHEYNQQQISIAAKFAADSMAETRFMTRGATPAFHLGVLTAGLTLLRANKLNVTAQYHVEAGSGYLSQAGTVKLRQLF